MIVPFCTQFQNFITSVDRGDWLGQPRRRKHKKQSQMDPSNIPAVHLVDNVINDSVDLVANGNIAKSIDALKQFGAVLYSKSKSGAKTADANRTENSIESSEEDITFAYTSTVPDDNEAEPSYVLFFQILFPFFIAGFGMVLAGLVLDVVQHWDLFIQVPEIFILVPALLGLKGNLEMTFASRLSTLANMGRMDNHESRCLVITSNLALIQVQAIVVSFLASSFVIVLAWIPKGQVDWSHAALLCASSLTTASAASFVLSSLMIVVVLCSRSLHINPDNVATPIAASLGDLTTLAVLSSLGSMFLNAHLKDSWLNCIVITAFLTAAPFWAYLAGRDPGAVDVLENGWSPIIFSMLISGTGGFILEGAIKRFPSIAVFQPVINGVGGNLAAIQASRLATYYHRNSVFSNLPNNRTLSMYLSFKRALLSSDWDARSARVLLFFVTPSHIIFNWIIQILHEGDSPPSGFFFTTLYICAALAQVLILLYACQWLVAFMWSAEIDPDCAAIPYLTALGDLLGTFLLFLIFVFFNWFNNGAKVPK